MTKKMKIWEIYPTQSCVASCQQRSRFNKLIDNYKHSVKTSANVYHLVHIPVQEYM